VITKRLEIIPHMGSQMVKIFREKINNNKVYLAEMIVML
jgi:hypothetical protein